MKVDNGLFERAMRAYEAEGRHSLGLLAVIKLVQSESEAASARCLHEGPEGLQCGRMPHGDEVTHLARRFSGADSGELDGVVQW